MASDLGSGLQRHHPSSPFDRLVGLLATGEDPGPGLARLGGPGLLDRLLRAALVASLHRGPRAVEEGWGPGRLLEAAVRGAALGAVPVATVARLRATLGRLDASLRRGGFWDPTAPLWWQPVLPLSELEEHWRAFEGGSAGEAGMSGLRLPPVEELSVALTSAAGAGWRAVPGALGGELVARLHDELASAERSGVLSLARGGVGQSDRPSPDRTDRVAYLTGFEAELLRVAPAVATFIQWLLARAVSRLVGEDEREGERRLHAPGSVMLARFQAPCRGFAPHLDNPGGEADNGRALTLVTYLNAPDAPCEGGEIALWNPAASDGRGGVVGAGPSDLLPAAGGTMVAFDARRVVHEVRALREGPDRWTAVVWLSDVARPRALGAEPPEPTVGEVLESVESVPLPAGRVLLRSVSVGQGRDPEAPGGGVEVESVPVPAGAVAARDGVASGVGVVCTTHRVGEGLEAWCRHHLALGVDHLLLVIDETVRPEDVARALDDAREMAAERGRGRIEVWTPEEAAGRRRALAEVQPGFEELARAAGGGAATHAVAARQTLNATAALVAARRGDLAGGPLDWLLHLDADELFHLEGNDRGGGDLAEHFAAAVASGRPLLRYVNHELLLPSAAGAPPRFKLNPLLAAIRLGPVGWRRMVEQLGMGQDGPHPYFRAYWNGKSAVRVAAGRAAAGVHGWVLDRDVEGGGAHGGGAAGLRDRLLAGPSILHLHLPTAEAFRDKYLTVAGAAPEDRRPFPPSPLEVRVTGIVRELRGAGAGDEELRGSLDALYREALCWRPEEVELLEEAGLVLEPQRQAKTGSS